MSNIQDRTVVHAARSSPTGLTAATLIGKYVTVEPNCVLRCAWLARSMGSLDSILRGMPALSPSLYLFGRAAIT